ncbi:dihydrofolate reductase [Flavilitoribacter nigricans]|uniref:Dihydrofolate reductase n=1 Tax=Flavilitoribacter nigricans (strain ATCC 23147 / DSM 23189 / NBRC 102662 / NCIMB 1420 / SS-2) TaxID=1122177 RepID=A0A2D0N3N7_FLAN2|nr:dihydrofolate reductase [Flavilitoribacter nigricans]PHN03057.1 diacylglycerol kinase [Flavilitoribacter nigricans DSM 23189 = NBRC 102662]
MLVSAIVAAARNRVIGNDDNEIPWYLSSDLKYFKKTTLGHHVIMGRNTFRSMGRPLPKRTNIILSRDPYFAASGCLVARSLPEALGLAYDNGETEAFIIGGGAIYSLSLPLLDKIYLTEVDAAPEGTVYFPEVDFTQWELLSSESHPADEKNDHAYTFKVYERIGSEEE